MVTFIQFRQELIFTSGGPRCAIEKKKKKRKRKLWKKIAVCITIQYQFYFSDRYIAD